MMNLKWFIFVHIWVVIIAADSESEYGYGYGYQKRCINILNSPITLNETVKQPGAKGFRK